MSDFNWGGLDDPTSGGSSSSITDLGGFAADIHPQVKGSGSDLSTSAVNEPPPQNFDLNKIVDQATAQPEQTALGALSNWGMAPGRIAATPVNIADIAYKRYFGHGESGLGPIAAAGALNGASPQQLASDHPDQGINIPIVTPVIGAVGGALDAISQWGSGVAHSLFNADRLSVYQQAVKNGGVARGPQGQTATAADLKQGLLATGFTQQELDAVASGQKSAFDFGDHRVSTDPLVEAGLSIVADPTNLLMFTPAAGAKVISWLHDAADIRLAAEGVGLGSELVKAGAIAEKAPDAITAGNAIAQGDFAQGTLRGAADFLAKTGTTGRIDNTISLLGKAASAYKKVALASTAAVQAADLTSGWAMDVLPKDNPVYGYMSGIHDFTSAVINDTVLTQAAAFDILTASGVGVHDYLAAGNKAIRDLGSLAVGSGLEPKLASMAGFGSKDPLLGLTHVGKSAIADFRAQYGADAALQMRNYVARHMAVDTFTPAEKAAFASTAGASAQELSLRAFGMMQQVDRRAEQLIRDGKVTDQAVLDHLHDWYTREQGGVGQSSDPMAAVDNHWNGPEAVKRFYGEYLPTLYHFGQFMKETGVPVVPYLKDYMSKEDVAGLASRFRWASKDGRVPVDEVRSAMQDYPALAAKDPWWLRHNVDSAPDPLLSTVNRKLSDLSKQSNSLAAQTYEFRLREAAAPDAHPVPPNLLAEHPVPLDEASLEAAKAASFQRPDTTPPAQGNNELRSLAQGYVAQEGLPPLLEHQLHKIDQGFGERTAEAYDKLPASDPAAQPAYEAFKAETLKQWNLLKDAGYTLEPWTGEGQPYHSSAEMAADVANNHHLWFFTGGDPHPFMSEAVPGLGGLTYNDVFRAVHDVFGHAQEGYQFGPRGEVNAAIKHTQMYSQLAQDAMLSETHGQNSFVNFSSNPTEGGQTIAEVNRANPGTIYADQKAALLPQDIRDEFRARYHAQQTDLQAQAQVPAAAGRLSDANRGKFRWGGVPAEAADVASAIIEARARSLGVDPNALMRDISVQAVNAPPHVPGAMFQLEAMQSQLDSAPTEAARKAILSEPPPQWLVDEGGDHARADPLVPYNIGGQMVYVPGGLDGTWSVWDATRMRAQKINTRDIYNADPQFTEALYAKMFRSQVRDLSDPMETFRLVTFALTSPQTDFIMNEARSLALRMRSPQEVADFAAKYGDQLGDHPTPQQVSAVGQQIAHDYGMPGSMKGLQEHLGNIALSARLFRDHPEFFTLQAGQDLNEFSDRLMNLTRGAGLKVGTFGPMLANPIMGTRGTIDVHMVRFINNFVQEHQGYLAELEQERGLPAGYLTEPLKTDAKGAPVIPGARSVKFRLANGQINPDVPAHLHDLEPFLNGQASIFHGSQYERANAILQVEQDLSGTGRSFDLGGHQWLRWDIQRNGRLEPHVAVYPGTYALSRGSISSGVGDRPSLMAAHEELRQAGFSSQARGVPGYSPSPRAMLSFQSDNSVVKGFTLRRAADTLIGLTPAADASTVLHELWHAVIEPSLSNQDYAALSKAGSLGEDGARNWETYLRSGRAPAPELTDVFARARALMLDVYRRLRGSPIAQRLSPEVRQIFDSLLTPAVDTAGQEAQATAELPLRMKGQDLTQAQADAVIQLEARSEREHPSYGVSPQPTDPDKAFFMSDPEASTLNGLALRERTALGRYLFDYGPGSVAGRFWEAMTQPVRAGSLYHDAHQAIYNELLKYRDKNGRTLIDPKGVDSFLAALNDEVRTHTVGPTKIQVFRGATALTKGAINHVAERLWTVNGEPSRLLTAIRAAGDEPADILDRSYNRWMRDAQAHMGDPGARGALSKAVDTFYNRLQDSRIGDANRLVTKTFYHIFRFILDPRWLAMQAVESDVMGAMSEGLNATRLGGADKAQPSNAMRFHSGAPPAPTGAMTPEDLSGAPILATRARAGYVSRVFDPRVAASAREALDGLPRNDPLTKGLVDMFGPNRSSWSSQLNDMLYGYDTKTVAGYIKQSLEDPAWRSANGIHWDPQTIRDMSPMIGKLIEHNQAMFDDVKNMFYGNPDRAQWERTLNNYLLYWPLSYQLKAAHWLWTLGSDRVLGVKTNMGGAATWAHIEQQQKQLMASDPAYQQMIKDHPTMLWLASLLFPLTPGQEGVRLSRVGLGLGGQLGIWNRYKQAQDPVSWATWLADLGPTYTFTKLIPALQREIAGKKSSTVIRPSSINSGF